jgi:zinc protease
MIRVTLCFLFLITLFVRAAEPPAKVDGVTFVKTVQDISEYTLDANGLTVLLQPEHSSPTLTFMVTYRVGSRNEVTGTTGATHLLEHLMFKGSPNFNDAKGNSVKQFLERVGGNYNATTWLDRTNYYANIGRAHLESYMAIEADRMRNLWLREDDRQPEMTVVRNEFERGENSPFQALIKEIFQGAYVAHPYHHSTIGWRSDIEKVSIGKLREFYDTFYWPDNATASVIGDFEPAAALNLIKKYYGQFPRAPKPIPAMYTEEPEQTGPRRVTVKRPGQLGVVGLGHKIPAATHADYAPMTILSAILTDGKNSRMYKALTDTNISTGVQAFVGFNHDPSLHITFIPLAPGAKHDDAEKIAVAEIERLKKEGVTEAELQSAIAKALADAAFQRDGSFAIAGNLNECIASGDWTLFYRLEEATKQVKAADVQRVANTYFTVDQSTTGWFIPIEAGGAPAGKTPAPSAKLSDGPYYYRTPGVVFGPLSAAPTPPTPAPATSALAPTQIAEKAIRTRVSGIDLIIYPTGAKNIVTLRGSLPAGDALAGNGNVAVPTLTGMLLDKGTTKQDKFAIASKLEAVGATINFNVGTQMLDVSAKCLTKDVPLVIGLIAEQLRTPALNAEEFAKQKKQFAGRLQRRLEDTNFRATDTFKRAVYPVGHPNRDPAPEELLAAIESAKLEDVVAFHQKNYGPANFTLVATGEIDVPQLQREVGQAFAGWTGGVAVVRPAKATGTDAARDQNVLMPGKTSITVVMGQASGLKYSDPDYQALRVATTILGSGFTGRLMSNVRDKEGLTYGIGSNLSGDTFTDGAWSITATFAPTLLDKGIASTKRQLTSWYQDGVTPAEVERTKTNLIGRFEVGTATTEGLADTILTTVQRGLDLQWLDRYAPTLNALTTDQVNAAVKKYIRPDELYVVKAGTIFGGDQPK